MTFRKEDFHTMGELATELHVASRTIRRWINEEGLPVQYLGRTPLIGKEAFGDWVKGRKGKKATPASATAGRRLTGLPTTIEAWLGATPTPLTLKLLGALETRHRNIVEGYLAGEKFEEIAEAHKISRARVYQLIEKARAWARTTLLLRTNPHAMWAGLKEGGWPALTGDPLPDRKEELEAWLGKVCLVIRTTRESPLLDAIIELRDSTMEELIPLREYPKEKPLYDLKAIWALCGFDRKVSFVYLNQFFPIHTVPGRVHFAFPSDIEASGIRARALGPLLSPTPETPPHKEQPEMTTIKSLADLRDAMEEDGPPPYDLALVDSRGTPEGRAVRSLLDAMDDLRAYGLARVKAHAGLTSLSGVKALIRAREPSGAFGGLSPLGILRVLEDVDATEASILEGFSGLDFAKEKRRSPVEFPPGFKSLQERQKAALAKSLRDPDFITIIADDIEQARLEFERDRRSLTVEPDEDEGDAEGLAMATRTYTAPKTKQAGGTAFRITGKTMHSVVMDHYGPSLFFTAEDVHRWLLEASQGGWVKRASNTSSLSTLKAAGFIKDLGGQRYQFIKPIPDDVPRPIGPKWLKSVRVL